MWVAAVLAVLLALPSYLGSAADAPPAVTVDTTSDAADAAFSCGAIAPDLLPGPDGKVSLREAMCAANARPGADVIRFSLPPGSLIRLSAPLPVLTDDGTTLGGDTAPGYVPNTAFGPAPSTLRPGVQVDASGLPPGSPVIQATSGGHRLAGLSLTGPGDGIFLSGGRASRNRIEGMWLGASLTDTVSSGLGGAGVRVTDAAANLVGGLAAHETVLVRDAAAGVVVGRSLRVKVLGVTMERLRGAGIQVVDPPGAEALPAPTVDPDSASTLTLVGSGIPSGSVIDVFTASAAGAPVYGRRHLGSFVEGSSADADHAADGRFTFPLAGLDVAAGDRLTVTATDPRGTTSPFSSPVAARTVDSDRDGLPDEEETARGLDPFSADTDTDGVADGVESCRCSVVLLAERAVTEVSSVTGRVLRRIALPEGAGPVSGLASGRGTAGQIVAAATPAGVAIVDVAAEAADARLIRLVPSAEATPTASGIPTASADGTHLYVPSSRGISTVNLVTRRLSSFSPVDAPPAALATGEGALVGAIFPSPSPGVGIYSVAEPAHPKLLFRSSASLPADAALTVPVALDSGRFAAAASAGGVPAVVVVFSAASSEAAITPLPSAITATIPVALTWGPAASQLTVVLRSPDGTGGAAVSVDSGGEVAGTSLLPAAPLAVAVSGRGGVVVALSTGQVVSVPAPGAAPQALVTLPQISPIGALGLAAPTTGSDARSAVSGPGWWPRIMPGARPPVLPAPLAAPGSAAEGAAPADAGPSGGAPADPGTSAGSGTGGTPAGTGGAETGGAGSASAPAGASPGAGGSPSGSAQSAQSAQRAPSAPGAPSGQAAQSPPGTSAAIAKGTSPGGLPPSGGGARPQAAPAAPARPQAPEAALVPTGLPAAPGGVALPQAVALTAAESASRRDGTNPFLWVVVAACAGFLIGALAVQPPPGTLGPRRPPPPAWMDDPQAAIFGPARRWERFVARPPRR